MNPQLEDLSVAITTSGRTVIQPGEIEDFTLNMVIAEVRLYLPIVDETLKKNIDRAIVSDIDAVDINPHIRKVFIGKDISNDKTALVLYFAEESDSNKGFFKRCEETQTLLFEYSVIRINEKGEDNGIVACASGIYSIDSWKHLKIVPQPRIAIKDNL
jgi:hypothetical protein